MYIYCIYIEEFVYVQIYLSIYLCYIYVYIDAIKVQIDNGTNEILIKPDWGVNMAIVDSVNNVLASSSSGSVIL